MYEVFLHCLWALEGWTDMRERVYRSGRGPRQHKGVGFGVSQAARTAKSQVNIGVLRKKSRWPLVFMVFLHCIWV